jgi:hypothetical protein
VEMLDGCMKACQNVHASEHRHAPHRPLKENEKIRDVTQLTAAQARTASLSDERERMGARTTASRRKGKSGRPGRSGAELAIWTASRPTWKIHAPIRTHRFQRRERRPTTKGKSRTRHTPAPSPGRQKFGLLRQARRQQTGSGGRRPGYFSERELWQFQR